MLVCPPACPEELSSMPSLKHSNSRKGICFVPATECRPSVPSERGGFPISDRTPCRVCAHTGVVEFCADGPGQPCSNSHGLETIPHSTTHHVCRHFSDQNRCYCGNGALSSMSSSYGSFPDHEVPFTTRPSRRSNNNLGHVVHPADFRRSFHIFQGAMRLGPQIQTTGQILSFWRRR